MSILEPAEGWLRYAACRTADVDPDEMFPDNSEAGIEHARQICAPCPVSRQCLADALRTGDNQHGIRGGLKPVERRLLAKELARRERAAERTGAVA